MILTLFNKLISAFGNQNWWPAETPFEVMVGAILTQRTTWRNVEKSIENLKQRGNFSLSFLYSLSCDELESLIKPSGFYKSKCKTLKSFMDFIEKSYQSDLLKANREETVTLRNKLTSIKGIGNETADSILLYAFNKPVFPVDAYTMRIYSRVGISDSSDYEELRLMTEPALSYDLVKFKEMHALIVKLGKDFCTKIPKCTDCPINDFCFKKGV